MMDRFIQLFLDKNLIVISLFINITFQIIKDIVPEEKKMQYFTPDKQRAIYRISVLLYSFLICYALNLISHKIVFSLQDSITVACASLGLYEIGLRNLFNRVKELLGIRGGNEN